MFAFDGGEIDAFGGVLDVDSDNAALVVEVDDDGVADSFESELTVGDRSM